ncbi:MAG: TRAP transporter small permease subunit [Deinococcales bacterium]
MFILKKYIAIVDAINYRLGRITMYGIFVLMAILLWSIISKAFFKPSLWTLEMAQFCMVAYYMLGGPYSIQLDANVRMDLFYGSWSPQTKAWVDAFSVICLIFYLGVLLYGGFDSFYYSLQYGGERSATVWRPYLWPIKLIICFALVMMILQSISELFKDIIRIKEGSYQGAKS